MTCRNMLLDIRIAQGVEQRVPEQLTEEARENEAALVARPRQRLQEAPTEPGEQVTPGVVIPARRIDIRLGAQQGVEATRIGRITPAVPARRPRGMPPTPAHTTPLRARSEPVRVIRRPRPEAPREPAPGRRWHPESPPQATPGTICGDTRADGINTARPST